MSYEATTYVRGNDVRIASTRAQAVALEWDGYVKQEAPKEEAPRKSAKKSAATASDES